MAAPLSFSLQFSTVFILFFLSSVAQADVPVEKRLKFVNQGDYGSKSWFNIAYYRELPFQTQPFTLCFYTTTTEAYTFAIIMGNLFNDEIVLLVWEANLSTPVHENATLTFGADGNLVLAEADGRVAWQTNTANKGVVDMNLLPNGNLVLQNSTGGIVWQSFDYPTNILLTDQSLRRNGPTKIVSRVSARDGSKGPYSLVLGKNGVTLYYTTKNSPLPIPYFTLYSKNKEEFAFRAFPVTTDRNDFQLAFEFTGSTRTSRYTLNLTQTMFDSTLSFIQLDVDGNVKIHTSDSQTGDLHWMSNFAIFNSYIGSGSQCQLPERCGSLGICKDNDCVACPTPQGLKQWSEQSNCEAPILPPCKQGVANVTYYKVVGVDHFSITKGVGPMKLAQCKKKCDRDCKCLAFFYRKKSSKCLLVPELGTLTQVPYPSHVAYIKVAK